MTTQKHVDEAIANNQKCIDILAWIEKEHYEYLKTVEGFGQDVDPYPHSLRTTVYVHLIEKAKADIQFTAQIWMRLQEQLAAQPKPDKAVFLTGIQEAIKPSAPNTAKHPCGCNCLPCVLERNKWAFSR